MPLQQVVKLSFHSQDRIEGVHGALEHHGHLAPAEFLQRLLVKVENVLPFEQDPALTDESRRLVQTIDRIGDRALAAAGLAGKAEDLRGSDIEADIVDGPEVGLRSNIVDGGFVPKAEDRPS
jgi:hypothetical protein